MNGIRYFEDYAVGEVARAGPISVTAAEIIEFARHYDPQPMHTDMEAAQTITGGLIASGWHTAGLTMRMFVESGFSPPPGALGLGVEALKWRQPVRPGDILELKLEVIALRESAGRPDRGIVTLRFMTVNQHGETVQEMTSSAMIPKRHAKA